MKDWLNTKIDERKEAAEQKQAEMDALLASGLVVDRKEQLDKIHPLIRPAETLRAVLDMKGGGTGFIAITDKRIIVYDQAFFGKRKAMVTIPFSKITRVASEDDSQGAFANQWKWQISSKLTIWVGSESYDFDFRGADKAHKAYELVIDAIL